jgi:hypothetical protein
VDGNLFFDAYDSTNGYSLWMVTPDTVTPGMVTPVSPALVAAPGKVPGQPEPVSNRTFAINRDLVPILTDARNGYQSESSSVSAQWQQADILDLQRLDALLRLEAGVMGMSKDTLIRDLLFASMS